MAISGSEQAYLYARSAIARSGATRSNYVAPLVTVEWITRDAAGNVVTTTDLSEVILLNSLNVSQALNDEPDTCSFELRPQEPPALVPKVGEEIRVAWTSGPGATLFYGYIVVVQADWRLGNTNPAWISVTCQDAMWRFDARLVTYKFPAQSVSDSIEFLVSAFCNRNLDPAVPHPLDFSTSAVVPNMPSLPAFEVVNQRPSTVMRTLTAAVGGGFYIDGKTVHAWPESISEPNQVNPTALTVGLKTLKSFRLTTDATQVRRRVIVEGRRTSTLIGWPTTTGLWGTGLPLEDATLFPDLGDEKHRVRIGAQWGFVYLPETPAALGSPPQAKVVIAFNPGEDRLWMSPVLTMPPVNGWVRVGNQYASYAGYTGTPLTANWGIHLEPMNPYGFFTVPLAVGETVEWVDSVGLVASRNLDEEWETIYSPSFALLGQPVDTPVVTLATAAVSQDTWPALEAFVQDGRYSYEGAQARAQADLDAFKDPLVSAEWVTEDFSAQPGRTQVINLSSEAVTPPIQTTVTILNVTLTFPLRTLPPRRACSGGIVKPSTFLDLVVTTSD
jgi:hypothetical protein